MSGFGDYSLDQEYQKIVGLGNKLGEIRDIIDWEKWCILSKEQKTVNGASIIFINIERVV